MKLTIPLTMLLLFCSVLRAQEDCNDYYSRRIDTSYVTWSYDGTTDNARYASYDLIDPDDVRQYIENAISKWTNAANQEGTRITFEEVTSGAWMVIEFDYWNPAAECGDGSNPERIKLNSNHTFANPGALETTILHEMGHAFLGSGHHGDGVMSQYVGGNCGVKCTSLGECEAGRTLDLYNPVRTIVVRNDFGSGGSGGIVKVDGQVESSGTSFYWREGSGNHSFEAIDYQNVPVSGQIYTFKYDRWEDQLNQPIVEDPTLFFSQSTTGDATFDAVADPMYDVTFSTSPSGRQIEVRDTIQSDGFVAKVLSTSNAITAEGIYHQDDRVEYTFSSWDDQSTTNPRTFYPSDHTTYTATYNLKPLPPPSVSAGGSVEDYVHVTWSSHPSSLVTQFQIWRKVKPKNQNEQDPVLLTTVSSSTTSYIDYDYTVTSGYADDLVWYDIRSVLPYGGSTIYSDPSYVAVFAEMAPKIAVNLPEEFSIQAFPNPFNPSTRILYALKSAGQVRMSIIDIAGREIAFLVDSRQSEGRYSIVWKGMNSAGKQVGSGVYFAQIVVTDEAGAIAFEQTIRLLLTK